MEFKKIQPTITLVDTRNPTGKPERYIEVSYIGLAGTFIVNLHTLPYAVDLKGLATMYDIGVYPLTSTGTPVKGLAAYYHTTKEAIEAVVAYIQQQVEDSIGKILKVYVA